MKILKFVSLIVVTLVIAILLASPLNSFTRTSDSALAQISPPLLDGGGVRGGGNAPRTAPGKNYLPIIFLNAPTDSFWSLAGNSGTLYGTNFLGTTDNVSLTLRVSNTVGFRLAPSGANTPNVIAGNGSNSVNAGVYGAVIAGGGETFLGNRVTDSYGTIGGGRNNFVGNNSAPVTDAMFATIGGGLNNQASFGYSTVSGGQENVALGDYATVAGGFGNTVNGQYGTTSGGSENVADSGYATVGGGAGNSAGGSYSTVGGGTTNTTYNSYNTIGGGKNNITGSDYSTVAGGQNNSAVGVRSTVGGGISNTAGTAYSFVGGGDTNFASNTGTVIGGGEMNTALGTFATIGGGTFNYASGSNAFIGGGEHITASFTFATVGGGYGNMASGERSFIGGGHLNTATNLFSVVTGGSSNQATGSAATVPGGTLNVAAGDYSFAAGYRAIANHIGTFVWGDSTNTNITSTIRDQFVMRATNGVSLSVNAGSAKSIDIGERYRDNSIIAWADVQADGTVSNNGKFGVTSITHSTGIYTITLSASAVDAFNLIPVVIPEVDSPPTSASAARLFTINITGANSFVVYITNGSYTLTDNQFVFLATAR